MIEFTFTISTKEAMQRLAYQLRKLREYHEAQRRRMGLLAGMAIAQATVPNLIEARNHKPETVDRQIEFNGQRMFKG